MLAFLIVYAVVAMWFSYAFGGMEKEDGVSDDEHFKMVVLAAALWPLTMSAVAGYLCHGKKKPEMVPDIKDTNLDFKV